jgi:pimeloyl-ACP methyl ester carboxylesterase
MIEDIFGFEWMGLRLVGTLHAPDSKAPHPMVVMIPGSGPSDRSSDGYFAPIREVFLARGIGTFAFDKPGCGDSSGDWRDHGLNERADQVMAAVTSLRHNSVVKTACIGLWGHSQGGWIVQMLAARLSGLPFAIANSGPSIDLPTQDLYGCEHSMRADGHPEADIDLALGFVADIHRAARQGLSFQTVQTRLLEPARGQSWYGYLTLDDEADWRLVTRFVTEGYQPLEALKQIRCPYLAVYGGRDVLLPAWRSAEETGAALQQAGNQDSAVVVFPEGDHRVQQQGGTFVPGYLELLAGWASTHVR